MSDKDKSSKIIIKKPNKHPFNVKNVALWVESSDPSIRHIASEFILKSVYINHGLFLKTYKEAIKEMLSIIKVDKLQIFINIDDINKSSYWIMQIIKKYINENKYTIEVVNDVMKLDKSLPVIIADDASYSGSQIANTLEHFRDTTYDIFVLIPFISNTAIDIIRNGYNDNNIQGRIMFLENSIFLMKPIYELMSKERIEKLFSYYTDNPKFVREYPIYFDHKVGDSYSSFPLIYTYGIIPNDYNKQLIHDCKRKRKPIKDIYSKLERIPILKNCTKDIPYNILVPPCPLQPYKIDFSKISSPSSSAKSYRKPKISSTTRMAKSI